MKKESGTRFGGGNGNEIFSAFLCVSAREKISATELVEVTNKMPSRGSGTEHSSQQKSIPKVCCPLSVDIKNPVKNNSFSTGFYLGDSVSQSLGVLFQICVSVQS